MSKFPVIVTVAAAAIGVLAGYLMIPGQTEQIAMLASDGHEEAALELADGLFEKGNREPAVLMQAFVLNEASGTQERGLRVFRAYLQERPDDAVAWQRAAGIFDESGQTALLFESLENILRITRDPAAATRLAASYRLADRKDDELRVLKQVAAKDLPVASAMRLAGLLQQRGQTGESAQILSGLDDAHASLPDDARIQLFAALIDLGKFDDAANRALKWRTDTDDPYQQDVLIGYLLRAGGDDAALKLARQAESFADPKAFAHLFQLLADQARYDLVGELLSQWVVFAREMPADQMDFYFHEVVNLAGAKGMSGRLFRELFAVLDREGAAGFQAGFVQAMFNRFGYAGVAPYRNTLRPKVLAARPVLAARLLAIEKNPLAARRFLLSARLPALSASAQFAWLDLAQQMLPPQELGYELARRARAHAIPPELQKAVLDTMVRGGSQAQRMSVWQAFFDSSPPASLSKAAMPVMSGSGGK